MDTPLCRLLNAKLLECGWTVLNDGEARREGLRGGWSLARDARIIPEKFPEYVERLYSGIQAMYDPAKQKHVHVAKIEERSCGLMVVCLMMHIDPMHIDPYYGMPPLEGL